MIVSIKRTEILFPIKYDWIYGTQPSFPWIAKREDGIYCQLKDGTETKIYQDDIMLFEALIPVDLHQMDETWIPVRVVPSEEYASGYMETVTDFMLI